MLKVRFRIKIDFDIENNIGAMKKLIHMKRKWGGFLNGAFFCFEKVFSDYFSLSKFLGQLDSFCINYSISVFFEFYESFVVTGNYKLHKEYKPSYDYLKNHGWDEYRGYLRSFEREYGGDYENFIVFRKVFDNKKEAEGAVSSDSGTIYGLFFRKVSRKVFHGSRQDFSKFLSSGCDFSSVSSDLDILEKEDIVDSRTIDKPIKYPKPKDKYHFKGLGGIGRYSRKSARPVNLKKLEKEEEKAQKYGLLDF